MVSLGQLNTIQRFREGADLVDLDQNRVRNSEIDSFLQKLRVGHKKIVADELHFASNLVCQEFPSGPIVFRHAVFDRDNRILLAPALPVSNHLIAAQLSLVALFEDVFLAVVKLTRRRIEREQTILAWLVAGFRNRFEKRFATFLTRLQIRGEATLVTDTRRVAFALQNSFELMKNFGADS